MNITQYVKLPDGYNGKIYFQREKFRRTPKDGVKRAFATFDFQKKKKSEERI